MNKKSFYLTGIVLTILVGCILQYLFCCGAPCVGCETTAAAGAARAGAASGLMIQGDGLSYSCEQNFAFGTDQDQLLPQQDPCLTETVAKLKADLAAQPDRHLYIEGYCTSAEKNPSMYPNLGFARAQSVKNLMVTAGIPASRITTQGKILPLSLGPKGPIGTIHAEVRKLDAQQAAAADGELKKAIEVDPLVVHFETNASQIQLSDTDREKMAKMATYLDHVPTAKLDVVGHTDNVGGHDYNVRLSKSRAQFIAEYIAGHTAIPIQKMDVAGKGPDQPVADNTTTEGKAKNRRTEVSVH